MAQEYCNWELIIVDDASTDDTERVVAQFSDSRIRYEKLAHNRGSAGARNAALEMAAGEFITYLDSDNTIEPDFLLILVGELAFNVDFDVVYCAQRGYEWRDNAYTETFVRFSPFERAHLENRNYIDIGVVMHRASVVEEHGTFNTQMQRLADWEWILRYTSQEAAKAVPAILSNYFHGKAENQNTNIFSHRDALLDVDATLRGDRLNKTLTDVDLPGFEQMHSNMYVPPPPQVSRFASIVIPSYESLPYLDACIRSIEAFTDPERYELIIVDNASESELVRYLERLSAEGRARIILNEANYGFSYAVNQGIGAAREDADIIIMNNDAIVTRGWLDALQAALSDHSEAGLVVPRQTVLPGEKTLPIHQPGQNPRRECDVNLSFHHDNVNDPVFGGAAGYMELAYAPFFCVYIPIDTLRTAGPLDVENGPHYRSDRLYCDLVRDVLGRKIVYTPHAKLYHFVQRATKELKSNDNEFYKDMFVRNDWSAITEKASVASRKQDLQGHLGSIHSGYISGWLMDKQRLDEPLAVEIVADGRVVASGMADRFRPDLQEKGLPPNRGYRLGLDSSILDGQEHNISVRAKDSQAVSGRTSRRLVTPYACGEKPWLAAPNEQPTEAGGSIDESSMIRATPELRETVLAASGLIGSKESELGFPWS